MLIRDIASGKDLNQVMLLDGSVTDGSHLNTGKQEISTCHHIRAGRIGRAMVVSKNATCRINHQNTMPTGEVPVTYYNCDCIAMAW